MRINSVLVTLRLRLLTFNQSITFLISGMKFLVISSSVLIPFEELVSSAYMVTWPFSIHDGRSFIYMMKRRGPKIEPWGTPKLIVLNEEV